MSQSEVIRALNRRLQHVIQVLYRRGKKRVAVDESEVLEPSFDEFRRRLSFVLETDGESSEQATELLNKFRAKYPAPAVEIVGKDVWGLPSFQNTRSLEYQRRSAKYRKNREEDNEDGRTDTREG